MCPLFVRGNCPGCRAGSHCASVCEFAPCSIEHGNINYCFECEEYPCVKYDGVDEHDSLISHKNQKADMIKAKQIGIDKYHEEQISKIEILNKLLDEYDTGHREVFFCLAVNLLDFNDLKNILSGAEKLTQNMSLNDKSDLIIQLLNDCGEKRNIVLKLRNDGYYG